MTAGAPGGDPAPCVEVRPRTSPLADVAWTIQLRDRWRVQLIVQAPELEAALAIARRFAVEHGHRVEGDGQ